MHVLLVVFRTLNVRPGVQGVFFQCCFVCVCRRCCWVCWGGITLEAPSLVVVVVFRISEAHVQKWPCFLLGSLQRNIYRTLELSQADSAIFPSWAKTMVHHGLSNVSEVLFSKNRPSQERRLYFCLYKDHRLFTRKALSLVFPQRETIFAPSTPPRPLKPARAPWRKILSSIKWRSNVRWAANKGLLFWKKKHKATSHAKAKKVLPFFISLLFINRWYFDVFWCECCALC